MAHHDTLVAIGTHARGTGFGRVLRSILGGLAEQYAVHFIGFGYFGETVTENNITLYPCNREGGDAYGAQLGAQLIEQLKPKIVFLLNDIWMLRNYRNAFAPYATATRFVAYCPLDGRLVDDSLCRPLAFLDQLVVYTEFARREFTRSAERIRATDPEFKFPSLEVIPHGVDLAAFRPLVRDETFVLDRTRRRAVRRTVFPDRPDLADAFLVLNANRPTARKRIDLTIQGFARFRQKTQAQAALVLHHAIMNPAERAQILDWADAAGVRDALVLSPASSDAPLLTDAQLNLLYNAVDVGLNTAMGEGWGLVSFEHAAAGGLQIVPDHSALSEIWHGSALFLDNAPDRVPDCSPLAMTPVTVESVAEQLTWVYAAADELSDIAQRCHATATRADYRWLAIVERWRQLLTEVTQR